MEVGLAVVMTAGLPLKETVFSLKTALKLVPVIVTLVSNGPLVGFIEVICGGVGCTIKFNPFEVRPPTVTTTLPVVAPAGTVTTNVVVLALVTVALVPLNVTVF
jgi:hypothetical protein